VCQGSLKQIFQYYYESNELAMNSKEMEQSNYKEFLETILHKIDEARHQAYKVVNSEQISLYWEIGKSIIQKQIEFGWGKSVVERLSIDLRDKTGDSVSFSSRNLWFMRQMYDEYSQIDKKLTDNEYSGNMKQLVSEIQNLKQLVSLVPCLICFENFRETNRGCGVSVDPPPARKVHRSIAFTQGFFSKSKKFVFR
jgi:hypothetical protein